MHMSKHCMRYSRRVKVERRNVPLSYTEFLIQPFGPSGLSQPLNSSMLEVKTAPPPKILLATKESDFSRDRTFDVIAKE